MALKALDQRLASTHNATNSTSSNVSAPGSAGVLLSPSPNPESSPSTAARAAVPPGGPIANGSVVETPKDKGEGAN